jgi:hypothetical protein
MIRAPLGITDAGCAAGEDRVETCGGLCVRVVELRFDVDLGCQATVGLTPVLGRGRQA